VQPRLVVAAASHRQIFQRHWIEIVVGERNEAEAEAAKLDDFLDNAIDRTLARFLAVGPPDRAERAMLRAAANGLHRCPHVLVLGQQVPARGPEFVAADPPALVERLRVAREALAHDLTPHEIAIAFDDGVCVPVLQHFVGKQGGVDAAVNDPGALFAGNFADFVAADGVAGMDADADDIPLTDGRRVQEFQTFVNNDRIPPLRPGRACQDEQPTGGDHRHAERDVAGVDQVDPSAH
jgi:hypothetical protein